MTKVREIVAKSMIALGITFLTLAVYGTFRVSDHVIQPNNSWDRFDKALYNETRSYDALLNYARSAVNGAKSDEIKTLIIFDVVNKRLVHGTYMENLYTNYVKYFMSFAHDVLGTGYGRNRILEVGNQALCSQSSYVFIQLANDLGLVARQVGLHGHVVAEVWFSGAWHMFDTDFETIVRDHDGVIVSARSIGVDAVAAKEAYGKRGVAHVVDLYASRHNNSYVSYPPGSYFEWKTNVLLYVEKASFIVMWLLPLPLLWIGLSMLGSLPRRRRGSMAAA